MPQIVIIGAGPAGALAAILLTRNTDPVTLIEQHRFPRDKVCGECLSALGIEVLTRHDLDRDLIDLHPTRLNRSELISANGSIAAIQLPRPMWGLSRIALDAALLDLAREAGATVLQPARCESIDDHSITLRDLVTNQSTRIHCDYTLIADGKRAVSHPPPTSDLGVKAHFADIDSPRDTISLFTVGGHYVGLAPIENNTWNIAMSVPIQRVRRFRGDLDALFEQLLTENSELRYRLRRHKRQSDWLASPLPRFPVPNSIDPAIIPIGNAAAALEPIGGEGMGLALRSAELAAEEVHQAIAVNRSINTAHLRRSFNQLWRTRRFTSRAVARIMSHPRSSNLLVETVNSIESISRPALIPLGK